MKKSIKILLAALWVIALLVLQTLTVKGNTVVAIICSVINIILIAGFFYCINQSEDSKRRLVKKNMKLRADKIKGSKALEKELLQSIEDNAELLSQSSKLNREKAIQQLTIDKLQNELNNLTDRYERAKSLYPNVDEEVNAMIEEEIRQLDMKMAAEFDVLARDTIRVSKDRDIIQKVKFVLDEYNRLNEKQKSYVKSDISKLERLYKNFIEKQSEKEGEDGEEEEPKDNDDADTKN